MTIYRYYALACILFLSCYSYSLCDNNPSFDENDVTIPSVVNDFSSVYSCFTNQMDEHGIDHLIPSATAFAIHHSGVVVTCNHSLYGDSGILYGYDGSRLPFELITRVPQYDLAFLRVANFSMSQISHLNVSPVLSRGESLCGIGVYREQLTSLYGKYEEIGSIISEDCILEKILYVELDAIPGCSGGPVFDQSDKIVGVIQGRVFDKKFCGVIPSVYIEKACREVMNLQTFLGLTIGLTIETKNDGLYVTEVDPASDACAKGIKAGDRIIAINKWHIANAIDFYLSEWAWGMERPQEMMPIQFISQGNDDVVLVDIALSKRIINCDSNISRKKLKPGCPFSFEIINDHSSPFASFKPKCEGWTNQLEVAPLYKSRMVFYGYIEIPKDESYGFHLIIPGSGKLTIGSNFCVEKATPHPRMIVINRNFFEKGFHAFTLVVEPEEPLQLPYLYIDLTKDQKRATPIPPSFIWGTDEQEL